MAVCWFFRSLSDNHQIIPKGEGTGGGFDSVPLSEEDNGDADGKGREENKAKSSLLQNLTGY